MSQVIRSPKMYDVCVIGSGAGGGTAAKILTEGGLSVALLEAGPPVFPEKDFKMLMWPYELPHRGIGVGGRAAENFGCRVNRAVRSCRTRRWTARRRGRAGITPLVVGGDDQRADMTRCTHSFGDRLGGVGSDRARVRRMA